MTPEERRARKRQTLMTQPVRLTMGEMAVLREALLPLRERYREAIAPFGMVTTWEATDRLDNVIAKVIEARCDLKRRQHPDHNPAGDSECEGFATDAELDAWSEAHPYVETATDVEEPHD